MSTRALIVVVLSCGIAGLGAIRPDSPTGHTNQDNPAPEVPQLLAFELTELDLPQAPGQAFSTTVPIEGQLYSLDLHPHSVRAADFQLLVDSGDGQLQPVEPRPPSTYRGTVRGFAGSRVSASFSGGRFSASIHFDDEDQWYVEPLSELIGPGGAAGVYAVYRNTDVLLPEERWCGTTDDMRAPDDGNGGGGGGSAALIGPDIVDLAADADVEFWQKNGSSVQNTMEDIETVINNVENLYDFYFNLVFEVTTIIVRTGDVSSDPYNQSECSALLGQFRSVWMSAPESSIRRDVAELFTGRTLSGCLGISYLSSVCNQSFHYSVVESRWPPLTNAGRTALSAHEIGHSFSAIHCNGDPDCKIMCATLGGCTGIITQFGSRSVEDVTAFAAGLGCLTELQRPPLLPFFDEFPTTSLDSAKWTYNDGGFVTSAAGNEPSPPNSLTLDSVGAGEYQDNEVRTNFLDLDGLDTAGVMVSYNTKHVGVESGETLSVEYWADTRWNLLERIISDGVNQTNFELWTYELTGMSPSPFHSEFRLRFRTDGDSSDDDWYIDDVFVGFDPPPNNDHCDNAQVITGEATAFSTIGATTDGVPETCSGGGGGTDFEDDVWFLYTADCFGFATFSLCNDADFDTRLAVYLLADCPPFTDLGCSDDAPGCGQTSELQVVVNDGLQYLVRVGSGVSGTEGEGTLTVTFVPLGSCCPCDCEDPTDGTVDVGDFLALLSQWGQPGTCDCEDPPDGAVDVGDFLQLLADWGDCP
jgi:hypothetical protein